MVDVKRNVKSKESFWKGFNGIEKLCIIVIIAVLGIQFYWVWESLK